MSKNGKKIAIIGGGAAGVMAAVLLSRAGFSVTLFEKNDKIGKKLLITGNGRCNLSNCKAASEYYFSRSRNLSEKILQKYSVAETLLFFESIGISVRELEKGKLYPYSLEAKTVVKAFLYTLELLGTKICYLSNVKKIEKKGNWRVTWESGDKSSASKKTMQSREFSTVVLCTGGKSYSVSGSDGSGYALAKEVGHSLIEPVPAIVQLVMDEGSFPYYKHLQGVKTEARVSLKAGNQILRTEEGELLFTNYGVSGPPILLLSTAFAYSKAKKKSLEIDFFPEMKEADLSRFIQEKQRVIPQYSVEHALEMFLPNRLISVLLKETGIAKEKAFGTLNAEEKHKMLRFLKKLELTVDKPYQWQQAQVTAGGISCLEVEQESLESKKTEGLYFAGEVLDMDGDCGGFNLQWAWSSAMAVANDIIKNNRK